MIRITQRGEMLIMCIPQIILVQVMHDSNGAKDAGISFSFKGGGILRFYVNYVFIAQFMLQTSQKMLSDKKLTDNLTQSIL